MTACVWTAVSCREACQLTASWRSAILEIRAHELTLLKSLKYYFGNLRRQFLKFASNAVSQRRCFARALLTLASPSNSLYSGCLITFLLSLPVANYNLFTIRYYYIKIVNYTPLYPGGQTRLSGNSNRIPPKIYHSISTQKKADYVPSSDCMAANAKAQTFSRHNSMITNSTCLRSRYEGEH